MLSLHSLRARKLHLHESPAAMEIAISVIMLSYICGNNPAKVYRVKSFSSSLCCFSVSVQKDMLLLLSAFLVLCAFMFFSFLIMPRIQFSFSLVGDCDQGSNVCCHH